jgi:hypothetical protein
MMRSGCFGAKDFVASLMEEGKKAIPPNIPA